MFSLPLVKASLPDSLRTGFPTRPSSASGSSPWQRNRQKLSLRRKRDKFTRHPNNKHRKTTRMFATITGLDFSSIAGDLVTYANGAALAGLGIYAAFMAVKLGKKFFGSIGK